jgi:hypothetical protein
LVSRYDRNRAAGVVDQAIALPLPPRLNDELAKAAEQFVADRYGLPMGPDTRVDPGWDFIIRTNPILTVDVKWSPRSDADLLVKKGGLKAMAYVLVVGPTLAQFRFAGWSWRGPLVEAVVDKGHGPCHGLPQSRLHSNVDLFFAAAGREARA